MGCVQSYFKKAHNTRLSPSSSQEKNSKQTSSDDGTRPMQDEKSVMEEPESNDTSYGVEATAVRTLAASTGTVAILGTTAKSGDKAESVERDDDTNLLTAAYERVHEENNESSDNTISISNNKAVEIIHSGESTNKLNLFSSECLEKNLKESIKANDLELQLNPSKIQSSCLFENIAPSLENVTDRLPDINSEDKKSSLTETSLSNEEITLKHTNSIHTKLDDKEDVISISSVLIKTSSVSNTTLSSDSVAQFDNNSIKQSLSFDKAIESFDSSSTVEFVDVATKYDAQNDKNESLLHSDGNNVGSLANIPMDSLVQTAIPNDDAIHEKKIDKNYDINDGTQLDKQNEHSKQANDTSNNLNSVLDNISIASNAIENCNNNKICDQNNATSINQTSEQSEDSSSTNLAGNDSISVVGNNDETSDNLANEHKEYSSNINLTTAIFKSNIDTIESIESNSKHNCYLEVGAESGVADQTKNNKIPFILKDTRSSDWESNNPENESIISNTLDETLTMAVTTIQSSFRGFQVRKLLKSKITPELAENETCMTTTDQNTTTTISSYNANTDKKHIAATRIQAQFKGFYMRKTFKTDSASCKLYTNDNRSNVHQSELPKTIVESVKEEVDNICKEAELIVAERAELVGATIKEVDEVVLETKESIVPTDLSFNKITTDNFSNVPQDELKDVSEKIVFDPSTIVQFESYHSNYEHNTKENVEDTFEFNPDYCPPAEEDEYLQSLEDLPPPDFEALESSFSEDVITEPLAPPPPLDQDSIIFFGGDDDEMFQPPQIFDEQTEKEFALASESSESSRSSAATKIQAGVRGFLARKQMQNETSSEVCENVNDKMSDAAITIQSRFRGYRTRKQLIREDAMQVTTSSSQATPSSGSVENYSTGEMYNTVNIPNNTTLESTISLKHSARLFNTQESEQIDTSNHDALDMNHLTNEPSSDNCQSVSTITSRSSGEYHDSVPLPLPEAKIIQNGSNMITQISDITAPGTSTKCTDDDDMSMAATKIQATFRAFKIRQEKNAMEVAATRIQSCFRKYKERTHTEKYLESTEAKDENVDSSNNT